jgi:hypothetical protein
LIAWEISRTPSLEMSVGVSSLLDALSGFLLTGSP